MDKTLRQTLIDWLDDNYHFGEAEAMIGGDDDKSFLKHGILTSLGFVELLLFIERTFGLKIDRKDISPANFDSMGKIMAFLKSHPAYKGPP